MTFANKTALVVEDTAYYRARFEHMLKTLGVGTVLTAKEGLQAVRKAVYYRPDIILLDLYMPTVDGFEACRRIRQKLNKFTTPILVISGEDNRANMDELYKMGVNDYFEKPIIEQEVINRIRFYLEFSSTFSHMRALDKAILSDLNTARSLMEHMLPDKDHVAPVVRNAGYDHHIIHRPSFHIGGDFWTVWPLENGDFFFTIMDISGHGIKAALETCEVMAISENLRDQNRHQDPGEYLTHLNAELCNSLRPGNFCVGGAFRFESGTGKITYAAAGIPEMKLFNRRGDSESLQDISCNGLPMGISENDFTYQSGNIKLEEHEGLCVLTDGLIECFSPGHIHEPSIYGSMLPGERLLNMCLKNLPAETRPPAASRVCRDILDQFTRNQYDLNNDDVTLTAFVRAGQEG